MMDLKLSISSFAAGKGSPETAVRMLAEAGFHCMELGHAHGEKLLIRTEEEQARFRQYAEECGIRILQGHLPLHNDITEKNESLRQANVAVHRKWLRMYHILGIRSAVLHCGGYDAIRGGESPDQVRKRRIVSLKELLTDLPTEMRICLENLPTETFEEVEANLRDLNWPEQLGFCLDTGHRHFSGERDQGAFIRKAGKRLHALHLHDNAGPLFQGRAADCSWHSSDKHMFPGYFSGSVNWQDVTCALRETGYDDLWNLEVLADFNDRIPGEAFRKLLLRQDREKAELIFTFDPDAPEEGDPDIGLDRLKDLDSAGVKLTREKYHLILKTDRYTVHSDPVHGGRLLRMNAFGRELLLDDRRYGWGAAGIWAPKICSGLFRTGMQLEKAEKTTDGTELVFTRTLPPEQPALGGALYEMRQHYTETEIRQTVRLRNDTDRKTDPFAFRFFSFPACLGGEGMPLAEVRFGDGSRWERNGKPVMFRTGKPDRALEAPMEREEFRQIHSPDAEILLPGGSRFRVTFPGEPPWALVFWDSPSGESTLEAVWAMRELSPGETAEFSLACTFL